MNRRVAAAALVAASLCSSSVAASATDPSDSTSTTVTTVAEPVEMIAVGMSVEGRPITAIRRGDPDGRRVLVFGVIHGDEQAGLQIVALLTGLPVPPGVDLYLVDTMNPDGVAATHAAMPTASTSTATSRTTGVRSVRRATGSTPGPQRRASRRLVPLSSSSPSRARPRHLVPPGSLHDLPRRGPRWGDPRPLRRAHRPAD